MEEEEEIIIYISVNSQHTILMCYFSTTLSSINGESARDSRDDKNIC